MDASIGRYDNVRMDAAKMRARVERLVTYSLSDDERLDVLACMAAFGYDVGEAIAFNARIKENR